MYDIKELKQKIVHGGIALSHGLEKRVMHDKMTDDDHKFLARCFGTKRTLEAAVRR